MKWAYYSDNEPYVCEWVRNLIKVGLVMDGEVDNRDIRDVHPADLVGFVRVHMFCGIAGWDRALRLAGWPDNRPVWTGSCPCGSFSTAGLGRGFADERHLWPYWYHLIGQCRPATILGEQVASPLALAWYDLVRADLEAEDYAVGAADLCAAGVGAPHIRQRLWFVGYAGQRYPAQHSLLRNEQKNTVEIGRPRTAGCLAHAPDGGWGKGQSNKQAARNELYGFGRGSIDHLEHAPINGWQQRRAEPSERSPERGRGESDLGHPVGARLAQRPLATDGRGDLRSEGPAAPQADAQDCFWSDAQWLWCTDSKWRPAQPGSFPLAHGVPQRVARLRALGNAIVPQVAAEFIRAAL